MSKLFHNVSYRYNSLEFSIEQMIEYGMKTNEQGNCTNDTVSKPQQVGRPMEFVREKLSKEHNRWVDAISDESERFSACVISLVDVLDVHFSILDYFWEYRADVKGPLNIGPRDRQRLSTAVGRQISGYSGNPEWKNEFEKCATLFYGLIKHRPFHDHNNRTALITALYYLAKLNLAPTARNKELEIITRIIASNELKDRKAFKPYSTFEDGEIRFLAGYLRKHTQPIDNRRYNPTYHQLNKALNAFGFGLDHPGANSIDIVRIKKRSSLFGLSGKRQRRTRVGVMAFSGWTREVPKEQIRVLIERTGLSAKDGIDRQSTYNNALPLSSLINKYGSVLQQLPDESSQSAD